MAIIRKLTIFDILFNKFDIKETFYDKKDYSIKYESVVQQKPPLHRPKGGLRRKMADFIFVVMSLN